MCLSSCGTPRLEILICDSRCGSPHLGFFIWESASQRPHLGVLFWELSSGIPHLRVLICGTSRPWRCGFAAYAFHDTNRYALCRADVCPGQHCSRAPAGVGLACVTGEVEAPCWRQLVIWLNGASDVLLRMTPRVVSCQKAQGSMALRCKRRVTCPKGSAAARSRALALARPRARAGAR